jgi:hypothetical protein
MKRRRITYLLLLLALVCAAPVLSRCAAVPAHDGVDVISPEVGGELLRMETKHGPLNIWRPPDYDPSTAGIVIYIHGYFTFVDQTWSDDQLATQFHDSFRNALFIAIESPQSDAEDVFWKSLDDLLRTVEDRTRYPMPRGPLVVMIHSGGYRTLVPWLHNPRVEYVILLDGLYGGQPDFLYWLRHYPRTKPHRMLLVARDTQWQSNRFSRRVYGAAWRRSIPEKSSSFTVREKHARLLYVRSQYEHTELVNSGKVIPVLLQISPLRPLSAPNLRPPGEAKSSHHAVDISKRTD